MIGFQKNCGVCDLARFNADQAEKEAKKHIILIGKTQPGKTTNLCHLMDNK
jgi:flagellar biosynthesis GTPase FlhF